MSEIEESKKMEGRTKGEGAKQKERGYLWRTGSGEVGGVL
jgi:hypothetical protein